MINVGNVNKSKEVSSSKTKKSSNSGNFASYLNNTSSSANHAVGGPSSISVADAIFSTQMIGSDEERQIKKHLIKRSSDMLDKLEEIRDGLILGHISKDKLIEISRFVKERHFNTEDDQLKSIIEEIELRVEVELAKLTRN